MKFLHTADWQMGMRAESVGRLADRVRAERLAAAQRVVEVAREQGAGRILLAGDVFENNAVDRLLVSKVGEILRSFPGEVHVIPGNHDPWTPGCVWEHPVWAEAGNITIHTANAPVDLGDGWLFPCPLREKYSTRDPTSWIDARALEKPAIGLAHGNVEGIPSGEPDYPIARDAAMRCGLDYLALGHWHSFASYEDVDGGCRMAYAGTHETTRFGERDSGNVVLVELAGRGVAPRLTPIRTGALEWRVFEHAVDQPAALEAIARELNGLDHPETTLVRVQLRGILFPEDRPGLRRIEEVLGSRFLFGALDATGLVPAPDGAGWIEALPAGAFREAAFELRARAAQSAAADERAVATQALLQLFDLHERSRL